MYDTDDVSIIMMPGIDNMAFGDRNYEDRPRQYHKAKCSDCGKDCEVPFRPTQGKPVYCRECYRKYAPDKPDRRRSF